MAADIPLDFESDVNLNENEGFWKTFIIQTTALLWKNFLVFSRKPTIFLFLIFAPVLVGKLLELIVGIGHSLNTEGVVDFPPTAISGVPRCRNPNFYNPHLHDPCVSIGYSIIGDSYDVNDPKYARYHTLMHHIAEENDFEMGSDVKALTAGKSKDIKDYIESHLNQTQYIVVFCHEFWSETLEYKTLIEGLDGDDFGSKSIEDRQEVKTNRLEWNLPCHFEKDKEKDMFVYYLMYNVSQSANNLYTALNSNLEKDPNLLALKLSVDNSILRFKAEEKGVYPIPKIEQQL